MAHFKLNECWTCDYRVNAVTKPSQKNRKKTNKKNEYKVTLLQEYACVFSWWQRKNPEGKLETEEGN